MEIGLHQFRQVSEAERHVVDPVVKQTPNQKFDHWCIPHGHQWFRKTRCEWPETGSAAAGQNYGTHAGGSGGAITLVRATSLTLENAGSSTLPSTPDSIRRATSSMPSMTRRIGLKERVERMRSNDTL